MPLIIHRILKFLSQIQTKQNNRIEEVAAIKHSQKVQEPKISMRKHLDFYYKHDSQPILHTFASPVHEIAFYTFLQRVSE